MSILPVFRTAIKTAIDRSRVFIYGEPSLLKRMIDSYEDFIGVKEVRNIQLKILHYININNNNNFKKHLDEQLIHKDEI